MDDLATKVFVNYRPYINNFVFIAIHLHIHTDKNVWYQCI